MKIGIITFHWAINYGAVLQAYALQKTLQNMGHNVEIINYKPIQFDNNLWTFLRYLKFLHIKSYFMTLNKEQKLTTFRSRYLQQTKRYYKLNELRKECNCYDALITGSDQVLNQSFLQHGEYGKSTAYFLDFGGEHTLRISYAASFGTTKYPRHLSEMVKPIVATFETITVREQSGIDIFREMDRNDAFVVPDPTILLNIEQYKKYLNIPFEEKRNNNYCVYMLHGALRKITNKLPPNIELSKSETIQEWISLIGSSKAVITNSFHGTVFSILTHTPFLIVLPTTENIGMNDRFFTMLSKLGLINRITSEKEFNISDMENPIDWWHVNSKLDKYRKIGLSFLEETIK